MTNTACCQKYCNEQLYVLLGHAVPLIVLYIIFCPVGGTAATLLTLGWSLSSSSKNSVVPPVSLATPCRSLRQA